jgi:hypothetical protein
MEGNNRVLIEVLYKICIEGLRKTKKNSAMIIVSRSRFETGTSRALPFHQPAVICLYKPKINMKNLNNDSQ